VLSAIVALGLSAVTGGKDLEVDNSKVEKRKIFYGVKGTSRKEEAHAPRGENRH